MSENTTLAVVTGGNRGLGFETCRQLARRNIRVILTSRSALKGEIAARKLIDEGLNVRFHQLDVTALDSARRFAQFIEKEHGRLDILVNNAGVFLDRRDRSRDDPVSVLDCDIETILESFGINTLGALRVSQVLVPLMTDSGRIVNVSSRMGQLSQMDGHWPGYRISKTALNAVTRILSQELKDTGIKVNSVCPGWVRTDLGGADAPRSHEEGVDTIVWAATLPEDGPSGGFFRNRQQIDW